MISQVNIHCKPLCPSNSKHLDYEVLAQDIQTLFNMYLLLPNGLTTGRSSISNMPIFVNHTNRWEKQHLKRD